jgi:hypothetical protein
MLQYTNRKRGGSILQVCIHINNKIVDIANK